MLHMVVMNHGPDTCAAVHPDVGEKARNGFGQMEEASKKHQVTIQGTWVDAPAHILYVLADAPNAHVIYDLLIELQLFHWNTVDIHPVTTPDMSMTARR